MTGVMPELPPPSTLFELTTASGVSRTPARAATLRVGRSADNDIVVDGEQTVSRVHAELSFDGTEWAVRDLGSHNGTYVNGQRVADGHAAPVTPSDIVGVGSATIRLLVSSDGDLHTIEDAGAADAYRLLTALSQREREVLAEVASGRTDDQIAAALFISVKTVHSHLDRIRDKTGLRRRAELTRLAVRLGLGGASPSP